MLPSIAYTTLAIDLGLHGSWQKILFATPKKQQQRRWDSSKKSLAIAAIQQTIRRAMNPKPTMDSTQEVLATVTIPYVKGISEAIQRILSKENIRVAFRSRTTVRSILTNVRPKTPQHDTKGVVYCIPCQDCVCGRNRQNIKCSPKRAQKTPIQWECQRFSSGCPCPPGVAQYWLGEHLRSWL